VALRCYFFFGALTNVIKYQADLKILVEPRKLMGLSQIDHLSSFDFAAPMTHFGIPQSAIRQRRNGP